MTVIEVAIGPGSASGMFRVEVVTSPVGEASATVELDADSLLARRGQLQQAVLASAVPSRRVLPETEQPVREVGQVLFGGLLGTGEVAGRYRAAAAVAAMHGAALQVVLRIDAPALAGLPWEAMYDPAAGAYVCRQDQLVRHIPVASVPTPLQIRPPLRILGVVSSPRGLPFLDVDKEQDQLARALARPARQGLAEVHWAPSATWADLQDLLLDGEWHVLHFIGHGDFDPGRDEGVLALVREDGRADLVAAHRLVDLLRQARPMPRLVVLNSCSGATAGASDLFSGTAAALVRGGVSAVAAMQYEISDPAAVAFARGFYAAIARGRGVDDAVSSGRVAILGTGDRTLEWVTPVLYLRGHDTRLFILPAPAEDTNREDVGSSRAQPGDTSSTSAEGYGPRGDSSAGQADARTRQPTAAQPGPGQPPSAPAPSRLTRTLGHTAGVTGVAFSPDGTLLATASGGTDLSARLWDVATGTTVRTLTGAGTMVAFSPDGTLLATASHSNESARLWDVATGQRLRTLTGHTGMVNGVAFSPDGTLLATASDDWTARLWDVATRATVRTLTGHT
ncbi:MAG: CHAT domain-containing protein [Streptosporangiaceae bacterium]